MAGPLGLLLYLAAAGVWSRQSGLRQRLSNPYLIQGERAILVDSGSPGKGEVILRALAPFDFTYNSDNATTTAPLALDFPSLACCSSCCSRPASATTPQAHSRSAAGTTTALPSCRPSAVSGWPAVQISWQPYIRSHSSGSAALYPCRTTYSLTTGGQDGEETQYDLPAEAPGPRLGVAARRRQPLLRPAALPAGACLRAPAGRAAVSSWPYNVPDAALWSLTHDGDQRAFALAARHDSFHRCTDGRREREICRNRRLFSDLLVAGPGEKLVLLTRDARALFVWRRFASRDGQQGINCALFRNEGAFGGEVRSSRLILAAEAWAWARRPGEQLYTYVDARRVQSSNPGYCFLQAGWSRCRITKVHRLLILEKLPAA